LINKKNNFKKRAFGLVLYEMISLRRLFDGIDIFKVIAAIMKFENINLNLNEMNNEMFEKILKK